MEKLQAVPRNALYFDSVNTTKRNPVFYYLRSLDSIANKRQSVPGDILKIWIWPKTGFVIRQQGYQLLFGKQVASILSINDVNTRDSLFPFMHPSQIVVEELKPKQDWPEVEKEIFCDHDLLSYFDRSYTEGGMDGSAIVLQVSYRDKIFTNEFSDTDTSPVARKVFSLVEMLKKNTVSKNPGSR